MSEFFTPAGRVFSRMFGALFPARRRDPRRRRGIALLMVMIGMVVCSILTAGFLATQGTSIGIARNERDAQKCRVLAQTGIDACYWLIRNKSDWREAMPIGAWLSNMSVGDGTVSVSAQDGDSTNSFADDPTQSVVLTSSGNYDSRAFTLTATVRPTGGGTVFYNGNFINGTITVGNLDLFTPATIDSYNSSVGPYSSLMPGSNANFASNSLVNKALTVYFPSVFRGSYTGSPTALLSSILNLVGLGVSGPTSTSTAGEVRVPGYVVAPNTTGFPSRGSWAKGSANAGPNLFPGPGQYSAASANSATITIGTSGVYYIAGNLSISNSTANLAVSDGVQAVVLVNGNVTVNGKITLTGSAQLALYCNNPITVTAGSINLNGNTSHFTLYGTANCSQIQILNGATVVGSVFAPQASFVMQTGSPNFYGAIVANSLTAKNGAQIHFDEALRSLRLSSITGGSAPGSADYQLTINGGPGLTH